MQAANPLTLDPSPRALQGSGCTGTGRPAGSLIIAFSLSGLVGVVFGLYPALRAANMDPVEALRHE